MPPELDHDPLETALDALETAMETDSTKTRETKRLEAYRQIMLARERRDKTHPPEPAEA